MIICPKCNKAMVNYNSYWGGYRCVNPDCNYFIRKENMTDEDKLYFNEQEENEHWKLDEPVENIELIENSFRIQWKDGKIQYLYLEDILKVVCKIGYKEIRALK